MTSAQRPLCYPRVNPGLKFKHPHTRVQVFILKFVQYFQVFFVGEPAIDTGGPTREFWRLLNIALQEHYFVGTEGKKIFIHNVPAIEVFILKEYCLCACYSMCGL